MRDPEPRPPTPDPAPPGRPPFAPPPGTPFYGSPPGAEWTPPPGTVFGGGPEVLATAGRPRRNRDSWPPEARPIPMDADPPAKDTGSRAVAILLALAAIVAAIVTARASLLSSDATSAWGSSVAAEQRRGALLLEGVRYTYGTEGDLAFMIASAEVHVEELQRLAPSEPPEVAARLITEAQVQQQVVDGVRPSSELTADPRYALPGGGYDIELRLADARVADGSADPEDDPVRAVEAGDTAADHANRLMLATIVIGLAFLFGALAQAVRRRRRMLLALGTLTLAVAAVAALVIELDAAGMIG